jgi:hypothetical protein
VIFEATPQSVLARPNTIQIAAAGNQAAWGGCEIYVSSDGDAYSYLDTVKTLGRTGFLTALLASGSDPDTSDTLAVDMSISGGELASVTQTQADQAVTLASIVDQDGSVELVSYETASLVAPGRYNLTYLRRGVYGTTPKAHGIGAEFAYVGQGVHEFQYPAQFVGKTIYFKFASFNLAGLQKQDLSVCAAYAYTINGSTLQPPSSGGFSTAPAQTLSAQAVGSAAQITVQGFEAKLNGQSVACTVAAPIGGLNQSEAYFVYYVDLAFRGGVITPIATQDPSDFFGKVGFYQLRGPNPDGSITTPGASVMYRPSRFSDLGSNSTMSPSAAYDGNATTPATVAARWWTTGTSGPLGPTFTYYGVSGQCIWSGFPAITLGAAVTLHCLVKCEASSPTPFSCSIAVSVAGVSTGLASFSAPAAEADYTMTIPAGTDLSSISVVASASIVVGTSPGDGQCFLEGFEIFIE